jgi:hypothetical protein
MTEAKENSNLDFALLILLEAVDRLTQPYKVRVTSEQDGVPENRTIDLPPLLEQLNDAIKSTQTSVRRGKTLANERSVIDASALMLEAGIRESLRVMWHDLFGSAIRPRSLSRQVAGWHVEFRKRALDGSIHADQVWRLAKLVQGWTRQIDLKFDPPVTLEITRPCPNCDTSHVFDFMGDRVAAVVISWRRSFDNSAALCRSCAKSWVGESELRQLRWEIDTHDKIA